jgi:hypothetical protein
VVDALDEDRSELKRFPSSGRIMRVVRLALFPERVTGEVIFKVPQLLTSPIFVTDRFAQRIQERGLVGFDLQPVWSGPDGALQVAA